MPVETEESIRLWEAISSIRNSVTTLSNVVEEAVANKSTSVGTDSSSDTKYPTVKAVKTFVNTSMRFANSRLTFESNRAEAAEALKENSANKSSNIALGTSDVLFPTQNAVKAYVDSSTGGSSTGITAEVNRAIAAENTVAGNLTIETNRATAVEALKENAANKSIATTLGTSDVLFPTQNAVKTYVDVVSTALTTETNRATAAEALKENTENKSTATTLGTSDILFPTQNAVKVYVDAAIAAIPSDYRIKDDV